MVSRQQTLRSVRRRIAAALVTALSLAACDEQTPVDSPIFTIGSLPDYAVTAASYTTNGPLDDLSTLTFSVTVRNLGGSDATGTAVSMYVDSVYMKEAILNPGETFSDTTVTFEWDADGGTHEIRFGVDLPPTDTSYIEEISEENNSWTLTLMVPDRERTPSGLDSIPFFSLPAHLQNDTRVQQMLAIASDSGYSVPPDAWTHFARYVEDGVTSFATPLGAADSSPEATPVLLILRVPSGEDSTTVVNLVQTLDSTTYVVYDWEGGSQLYANGEPVGEIISQSARARLFGTCSEPWVGPCKRLGAAAVACVAHVLLAKHVPTARMKVLALRTCAWIIPAASPCAAALTDSPPKLAVSLAKNGPHCKKCVGQDRVDFTYDGYTVKVIDDRPGWTYITAPALVPTCSGGWLRIAVRDCGGNIAGTTVHAVPRHIATYPKHRDCHKQGASFFLSRLNGPSFSRQWALRGTCSSDGAVKSLTGGTTA